MGMDDLKTSTIEIKKKVVKFRDTVIAVPNITEVTTFVPKPPFPIIAIVPLLLGFVFLSAGDIAMIVAGLVLMLVGAGWIALWYQATKKAPKGITLKLNSGASKTVAFPDHELANRVLDALEAAMQTESVTQVFNLPNATIKDSAIGNIGGLFKR